MYYRNSGKFSPIGLLLILVMILIGAPVLGFIYAHALWYIPIIYLNFLITIVFGLSIGWLVSYGIKIGKIRNTTLALFLGLVAGLVALYSQWIFWLCLVANAGKTYGNEKASISISYVPLTLAYKLIINPKLCWELVLSLNQTGSWGLRGYTPTGLVLWVIWALEALIVFGTSLFYSFDKVKHPFCEASNQWAKEMPITKFFQFIEDGQNFKEKLERRDYTQILAFPFQAENELHYSFFSFYYCPGSHQYYLSVVNKVAEKNKKGEIEYKDDTLLENIEVDQNVAEQLFQKAK